MDYLEKPPVNRIGLIFKCITVSVFLLASVLLGSIALTSAERYETVKANPLVLQTKVTYVDVDIDSENGDDYNAMVEYVYNGVKYQGKYKTFSTEKKARELVGKTVTIYVDPENPGRQISEIRGSGNTALMIGSICMMLAVKCLHISHRQTYVDTYGWRREAIKKDILHNLHGQSGEEMLLMAAFYFGISAMHPAVYLNRPFFTVIALVIAAAGVIQLIRKLAALRKAYAGAFTLRRDVFVSKEIITDPEDPDVYKVTYENENGRWTRTVSRKVYNQASEGDVIQSVYLEGKRTPILNRTSSGAVF